MDIYYAATLSLCAIYDCESMIKKVPPEYAEHIECTWGICMEVGNRCKDINECSYGYIKKPLPEEFDD